MRDRKTHLVAGVAAIGAAVAIGAGVVYATSSDGQLDTPNLESAFGASNDVDESIRSTLLATLQESDESPGSAALDRLAENLGISREALDDALKQTALELVDQALADGDIDEERAAALRERIESGEPFGLFGRGFKHFFGSQFEGGIAMDREARVARIQALADEGVIDRATADAIIAAIEESDGPLSLQDLVDDGVITQDAADAIGEALPLRGPHFPGGIILGGDAIADRIQSLADEGVIDQAAAGAIIAALEGSDGPVNLNDLVDDGIITEETLDAIRDALPLRGPGHRFHGPGGFPFGGEDGGSDDSSSDGQSNFEA